MTTKSIKTFRGNIDLSAEYNSIEEFISLQFKFSNIVKSLDNEFKLENIIIMTNSNNNYIKSEETKKDIIPEFKTLDDHKDDLKKESIKSRIDYKTSFSKRKSLKIKRKITISTYIIKYLKENGPSDNDEIRFGIKKMGFVSKSKNANLVIYQTLFKLKSNNEIKKGSDKRWKVI